VKALLVLLALAGAARADSLGVVIEAPTGVGGPLRVRIETWAADQHHDLVAAPLSLDGAKTLANCIVVDDLKCASAVVDARGKADNVIYVHVDATTTSLFWFRKHHPAARQKLACAPCTDDLLESMLAKVADKSEGNVPEPEEAAEAAPAVHAPEAESSAPRWPWYTMGAGTALIATGVILYVTSESPTGAKPEYLNDRPIGTAIAIGGAAVVAVGAYFALTHSDTAPTVAMTPGGAVIGFATLIR
jgi:hypothetical protein